MNNTFGKGMMVAEEGSMMPPSWDKPTWDVEGKGRLPGMSRTSRWIW